jgi:2-C-methyl-D-erythritol 4-phosphate cytidylyltransferase
VRWGAVIVAAGRGERFGRAKQLVDVAGRPLVAWSIATFGAMPEIVDLVVATEPEHIAGMRALAKEYAPRLASRVVPGGATRQESVRLALSAVADRCAAVLVHDGARPLIRTVDVRAGMRRVRRNTASLLATPVVDTIKVVDPQRGEVLRTLDRATLWAAQTPQFALLTEMRRAHADAHRHDVAATDDAALLERAGLDVVVVPCSGENFKVTLPADRERADALLLERGGPPAAEEEILLVEAYVDAARALAVTRELEGRRGRVDAVDRDLPDAVVVRAYVPAEDLHGFGDRFAELAGQDAVFTAHHAHYAPRPGERAS